MELFKKKRAETNTRRCEGSGAGRASAGIKVLGSGCAKCNALEASVRAALTELGMDAAVDHVTDFAQIASYGVMTTPALVVDGQVVSCGRVLKKEEAKELIQRAQELTAAARPKIAPRPNVPGPLSLGRCVGDGTVPVL